MKTYLVTGGLGFIGLNYIKSIINNKNNFIINFDKKTYASNDDIFLEYKNYKFIKGDISNIKQLEKVFKEFDIDYVINFAAESHVDNSFVNAQKFLKTNILGVASLLCCCVSFWKDFSKKRFIQISTDEVYGECSTPCFENSPYNPSSPYAITKTCGEELAMQFYKNFNLPVLITRSSNNFGEYQHPEKLIPKVFLSCQNHDQFTLYKNSKYNKRTWLYVNDNVSAINLVLKKGKVGEIYNIGSFTTLTNFEMINKITQYFKQNINKNLRNDFIKIVNLRPYDDKEYNINFDKITKLGFKPTDFEKNFEKTMDFYKNNAKYLQKQSKKLPK